MKTKLYSILAAVALLATPSCGKKDKADGKEKKQEEATAPKASDERPPRRRRPRGMRDPAARVDRLKKRLDLSDEQAELVDAAFKNSESLLDRNEALEKILDPEQLVKYEKMVSRRPGARRAPERAAKMKEDLDLSDKQAAELEALFKERKRRAETEAAIKEILTPEQQSKREENKLKQVGRPGRSRM